MSDDFALDMSDLRTRDLLRDLADLKQLTVPAHRTMIAKHALENLVVLEARGACGPETIASLRASVLRELMAA